MTETVTCPVRRAVAAGKFAGNLICSRRLIGQASQPMLIMFLTGYSAIL